MAAITHSIQKEMEAFLAARKNIYQFLHFLFQEPINESAFFELRNSSNLSELAEIHDGGKILMTYFNQLSEKQLKEELEEYERLFLGPGPLAAPPWESFYRSKEHLLFEEWTYEVRKEYHRYGLTFIKENNEPDDHLLLELEFMIFLVNACLQIQNVDQLQTLLLEQISFLENHLMKWVPLFCQEIIDCSRSQLYIGAAMLLTDFLDFDFDSLLEIKEVLIND